MSTHTDSLLDAANAEFDQAIEADKEKATQLALGGDKPPAPEAESGGGFTRWMAKLPQNVGVGILDAAINTVDFVDSLRSDESKADTEETPSQKRNAPSDAASLGNTMTNLGGQMASGEGFDARRALLAFRNHVAGDAVETSDSITQGVAQFAVPFAGWSKAARGIQLAEEAPQLAQTAMKVARVATSESATMATAFDPHAGRFADLIELGKHTEGKLADALNTISPDGSAINAYIDYMTDRVNEGEAEGRFKNVVDNLGISAAVAGLIHVGAKSFKAGHAFSMSPIKLPEIGAPEHLTGADMMLPDVVNAATPAAGTTARSAFEDLLEKALRRDAMEAQGRNILEDMVEAGESPKVVGERFWKDTYYKLNAQTQQRFQRYAKNLGFEPGQTLAVNADGSTVVAKDWQEVGEFLLGDMPKSAEHLEGTERGFVSMMKWANTQADRISEQQHIATALTHTEGNPHAAMVHLGEQADNTLDDAEHATIKAARDKVAAGLPEQGYTVVPTAEGHTVVAGKQPVLTFLKEEDAVAAVADAQRLFGTKFQQRAAQEHAKSSDANFATLHSFSRVLASNKDRPVSTHSLLSALERNLKGDTETGAFYKELLGRLVRKKLGGETTVISKSARGADTAGHYATAMNTIELYDRAFDDPKRLVHTFAHEAVHAATMHEMNASAAVLRKMEALRKEAVAVFAAAPAKPTKPTGIKRTDETNEAFDETYAKGKQYGFTNAYEFVAEIEANPEFRKLMQKTQIPEGGTAWDEYLKTIAGILGVGSLVATPAGQKEFSKLMMGPKQEEKPSA